MRSRDRDLARRLDDGLRSFERDKRCLLGIRDSASRESLLEQLIESVRRVTYVSVLRMRPLSGRRGDPDDELFDPLKAAILHQREGDIEEAFWLVFLFVHFGKNSKAGWRYAREIYGRLGAGERWDWASTSADPAAFRAWLGAHQGELRRTGVPRGFGNHRKYQSLDAHSSNGTGATVESYVEWVSPPRTHRELMAQAYQEADCDPRRAFDALYGSMTTVVSFGRLARFDYLTMVGKLQLAHIEPGRIYLEQSTGPRKGAELLFFGGETTARGIVDLEAWLLELDDYLEVGMQVLEDALCNWQKSPRTFRAFRT